jgi:hypothetical protein
METNSERRKKDRLRGRSTSGAIRIESAEGHGVGRTTTGAEDARTLAQQALSRAAELISRSRTA